MDSTLGSIEHAQDSLVQACAVVSVGVSDIGMSTMGKKGSILKLVFHQVRLIHSAYKPFRSLDLKIWHFLCPQTIRQILS
jgi:hypothetical protein